MSAAADDRETQITTALNSAQSSLDGLVRNFDAELVPLLDRKLRHMERRLERANKLGGETEGERVEDDSEFKGLGWGIDQLTASIDKKLTPIGDYLRAIKTHFDTAFALLRDDDDALIGGCLDLIESVQKQVVRLAKYRCLGVSIEVRQQSGMTVNQYIRDPMAWYSVCIGERWSRLALLCSHPLTNTLRDRIESQGDTYVLRGGTGAAAAAGAGAGAVIEEASGAAPDS